MAESTYFSVYIHIYIYIYPYIYPYGSTVLEFLASPSESEDLDKMAADLALVGGASTVV